MPTDVLEKVCVKITAYDKLIVVHETIPVRVFNFKTDTLLLEKQLMKILLDELLKDFEGNLQALEDGETGFRPQFLYLIGSQSVRFYLIGLVINFQLF